MLRRAGRAAVLAVVVLAALSGAVAAFDSDALTQVDVETDSTTLNVDVGADGNASWEVVYRIQLDDENRTAAFEDLAQDVASDPATYRGTFRDRMERTVAAAENATGREMSVRNVSVETRRESQPQGEYGLLVYRFAWTDFAAVDGDTVEVGDAIDQFFLDGGTTLSVSWPADYAAESVSPDADVTNENEVVWQGQRDFDAGQPRVVLVPEDQAGSGGGAGDGGDGADGGDGTTGDGTSLQFVLLLALGAMLVASAVWLFVRESGMSTPLDGDDGTAGAAPAEDSGDAPDTGADDEPDGPPAELLSNEERVLRLLEDSGGRMKQKAVAEQLDWTAAKTSQVVGDLRDEDKLDSFRLGRENVLTLPDVELEPSGPDDEE
ncbi:MULTISPECIES: DUF7345 domain-containing protein [Salinibaculum]|uniref:DUF7345 domain-containing protein n=1 Tax=Salinibaculum TaxID=2732368 RepID=UPI0030CE8FB6